MSIESRKIQKILRYLTTRNDPSGALRRPTDIEPKAIDLLNDYLTEITAAILEDASQICQHRKSLRIDPADINLILGELLVSTAYLST